MKNLFVISAIHHLIQVEAVVKEMHLSKKDVPIVFFTNKSSEEVSLKALKVFGYENYRIFEYWEFQEIFSSKKHSRYIQYLKSIKYCENLFISQYSSDYSILAYKILAPKKVFLLDEGTASFKVIKDRQATKVFDYKFFIKSILYHRRIYAPKKIIYYTQYDLGTGLGNDEVIIYSFAKEENQTIFDHKEVLVLGSSIAEVEIVSKADYMEIITKIKERHQGKKLYYYPHRKENAEKLEEIKGLGFDMIRSNMPFEFYYKSLISTPMYYYSFYSPILDNLSQQFHNLPHLNIIKLEENIIIKNHQIIKNIYDSYVKNKSLNLISPNEI